MSNKLKPDEINQLLNVIDNALQSDSPAVISALQNLVLLAGLTSSDQKKSGPIQQLSEKVDRLESALSRLEDQMRYMHMEREYRDQRKYVGSPTSGNFQVWYDDFIKNKIKSSST